MKPEAAADEAEALLEGGFRAVKLRLGYPTIDEDLAVTRAVRRRLPDEIALMVDYNQALSVHQALERGRALDDEGIAWIEEPIRHDDRSEEHTSELQSLMRISYAVFCLKKKNEYFYHICNV